MYTSGRTVKSTAAKPTTVATATATGRRLAKRHLRTTAPVFVDSQTVADARTMQLRMRTTIGFAEGTDGKALATAIEALPGYHSMAWNRVGISYLIELS